MQFKSVLVAGIICCFFSSHQWAQEIPIDGDTLVTFTLVSKLHQSSSVYQNKLISARGLSDESDLRGTLVDQTSIYIKDGGPGVQASSGSRGGTAQQQVILWNGMLLNSPSLGYSDLNVLPAFLFDELEVSSGPGSLIKSDGVIGTALDLKSIGRSQEEGLFWTMRSVPALDEVLNTFTLARKMKRTYLRAGGYLSEAANRFSYLDYTEFETKLKRRSHASQSMWGLKADVIHHSKKNASYQVSFQHSEMDREVPPVLGTVNRGETLRDVHTRSIFIWNDRHQGFDTEIALGLAQEDQFYSDSLSALFSAIKGIHRHSRAIVSKELNKWGRLRFKANVDQQEVKTENYSKVQERMLIGTFIEWEKAWNKLAVNGSVRQAFVDGRSIPNTGSLGIRFVDRSFFAHASAGRTYRIPTFNDLYWNPGGNPNLLPEQGWSSQVGLGRSSSLGSIGINYFLNDISDMIVWLPSNASYWSPVNRTRLTTQGWEFDADLHIAKLFTLKASLTYTDIISWKEGPIDMNEKGLRPLYVPRFIASYQLIFEDGKNNVSLGQRWNGEVYTDNSNLQSVAASFPMKLAYSRSFITDRSIVTMGFSLNNLLNEDYELIRGRPLPRRYLQFDLAIHLKPKP